MADYHSVIPDIAGTDFAPPAGGAPIEPKENMASSSSFFDYKITIILAVLVVVIICVALYVYYTRDKDTTQTDTRKEQSNEEFEAVRAKRRAAKLSKVRFNDAKVNASVSDTSDAQDVSKHSYEGSKSSTPSMQAPVVVMAFRQDTMHEPASSITELPDNDGDDALDDLVKTIADNSPKSSTPIEVIDIDDI